MFLNLSLPGAPAGPIARPPDIEHACINFGVEKRLSLCRMSYNHQRRQDGISYAMIRGSVKVRDSMFAGTTGVLVGGDNYGPLSDALVPIYFPRSLWSLVLL